jgi:biopolymer transport protein ExbB/TolQ
MIEVLSHTSIAGLLSLVIVLLPLPAGIAYAMSPTEQRLALMRPVSLAGLFAGLGGTVLGVLNVLQMVAVTSTPIEPRNVAPGLAEALVPLFLAFASLTAAWLCAALGLRRHL